MANEYLTVKQAQYLLEKWKTEAESKFVAQNGGVLTDPSITNGTLSLNTTARNNWLSALGMGTAAEHNGSSTSVPNNKDTTLCNSGSLAAGTYLLQCMAQFGESSSGRRILFLTTSSTGSNINRYTQIIGAPSPSNYTQMSFTYPVTITATTTFYLRAYQNSGGAINVTGGIRVLKIH